MDIYIYMCVTYYATFIIAKFVGRLDGSRAYIKRSKNQPTCQNFERAYLSSSS